MLNTEKFNVIMAMEPAALEALTKPLANSLLNLDPEGHAHVMRAIAKDNTNLQRIIPPPTPEGFNATSDETVINNAKKGTDHHTLYKEILSCSDEQKEQLKGKFGVILTKFATCNLLFLYIEGSKTNDAKGLRNTFAMARQALNTFMSETDRIIKMELFTRVLTELYNASPFQHADSFITNAREASQYANAKKGDNAAYLHIITRGVNADNALTLFDSQTLSIMNPVAQNAKTPGLTNNNNNT